VKLLVLPRYGKLGASSRLRSYQYFPWFERSGITVQCRPLFDDYYVQSLYANKHAPISVLSGYLGRIVALLRSNRFDALYLEKEMLPWLPGVLEIGLLSRNTCLVVDYDDAVFHNYDRHQNSVVRSLLGKKLDRLMARADLVTVGNNYLGDRAISAGSRRVEWVPTVIDLDRYPIRVRSETASDEVVVGWIGSPSTAKYLKTVSGVLEELRRIYRIRCIAIGAREDQLAGTPFVPMLWHENTEVSSLHGLDIGIMPLPDGPWERGKCGYKLIQYMACGLPVVASPVGVNRDIIRHDENGFLASNEVDWTASLRRLITDASLRARMGAAGRERVEREFCLQVQAPRLAQMLRSIAG
jgi:glycosyltransferase involved in cell wall biosynthesis